MALGWKWLVVFPLLLVGNFAAPAVTNATAATEPWIGVSGNHLIDGDGKVVRLLGVNRSGAEYACVEEGKIFDGPTDWASIEAMKSWKINAVRLPLNESCWLGTGAEVDPRLSGSVYRSAIHEYVERLERAGLYVILDLHWAAPGRHLATGLLPLPDAEHAPDFWRSVAAEFVDDRSIVFDVYNEPHDVGWDCWSAPCQVTDKWFGGYEAASLPELLAAIRSTGAPQPVMLGGLDWARDLRGWLDYRPADPAHALVAANHTYDFSRCDSPCRKNLASIARRVPVVTGELGEGDCRHRYIDPYMRFADRHGISYLGWTWNTGGRWECGSGPSLIRDWEGHPTPFGKGLREHLRRLYKRGEGI
jgi:endoglucanase